MIDIAKISPLGIFTNDIIGLDHIAIAVSNLEAHIILYTQVFGGKLLGREFFKDGNFEIAVLNFSENLEVPESSSRLVFTNVEFLTPGRDVEFEEGLIHRFLAKRGDSLHHVAFRVKNLEDTILRGKSNKINFLSDQPFIGSLGKRVIFIDPRTINPRILVEFCETAN